jgi:DNA-directed RNA polymerase specialized sigma24 family protein
MDREKLYEYLVARGLGADTASKVASYMITLRKQVQITALLYIHGYNMEQIAGRLKCNIGTVSRRIDYFKRKMKTRV